MSQLWQTARPTSLDDFVGQADAIKVLRAFESGFCLIFGEPGCGKTTASLLWADEKFQSMLPWTKQKYGTVLREGEKHEHIGQLYLQHCHANDFDPYEVRNRTFFGESVFTCVIIDEAQELTAKRQQSKLKTIPLLGNVAVVLVTQDPGSLEESIVSRCVKVRMSPLTAKELPELVQRACKLKDIGYDPEYVRILNRGDVRTPRNVLNFVDAVSLGVDPMQAVIAQR